MTNDNWRAPTTAERAAIERRESTGAAAITDDTPMRVLDGFSQDVPGYHGPVCVVVFGSGHAESYGFKSDGRAIRLNVD